MTERAPRLRRLADEAGLRRAANHSLGLPYGLVLVAGGAAAWALGSAGGEPLAATWPVLVSLILWQPLLEELLFRGLLQGYLGHLAWGSARLGGLSAANVAAAAAFAVMHLVHQPVFWALGTFFPALLFGLFRDRSGSLWPAVIMHIVFNAAFFAPGLIGAPAL